MGARSRSVFLASLVPAVLLGGVFAVVQAQNAGASAKATKWSDPATWPNNKVPAAGDTVAIAKDRNVILDVRSEEHTSELQSQSNLVCRLLLEKKKDNNTTITH